MKRRLHNRTLNKGCTRCGVGSAYRSGSHETTPGFFVLLSLQSLVYPDVFCKLFFILLCSFCIDIVISFSAYEFECLFGKFCFSFILQMKVSNCKPKNDFKTLYNRLTEPKLSVHYLQKKETILMSKEIVCLKCPPPLPSP